jgi:hypothetical protein
MDAALLVQRSIELIKAFNPSISTLDSHVLDQLGTFTDVRGA